MKKWKIRHARSNVNKVGAVLARQPTKGTKTKQLFLARNCSSAIFSWLEWNCSSGETLSITSAPTTIVLTRVLSLRSWSLVQLTKQQSKWTLVEKNAQRSPEASDYSFLKETWTKWRMKLDTSIHKPINQNPDHAWIGDGQGSLAL